MNEREIKIYLKGVKDGLMAATSMTEEMADEQINVVLKKVKKGRPANSKKIPSSQRYMKYVSKKSGKVSYKPNPNWDGTPSNKKNDGLVRLNQKK